MSKMSKKDTIKVVKRSERQQRNTANKPKSAPDARKTGRDMVATVTSWVHDLQRRRSSETAKAVNNLMRARQQPAES